MKEKGISPVRRAALYCRVSTEEQARKGYSIPAQLESLQEYVKKNGYVVAGTYVDEGKSARKRYTSRPEFMRLMKDVEQDKLDVILFIKLDRWFRNIADYCEVQKILDAHNVCWRATQEDYETVTASGQFKVNIMLAVAQNEADRTSERIKFVFQSKVAHGEVITGALPIGLKSENKKVVHDPEKVELVRDLFRAYDELGGIWTAMRYVNERYSPPILRETAYSMLHNPLYKGVYRDNENYCEPIIPPEEFDRIQEQLQRRSVRRNQTGRVFIFSGLLICSECGKRMVGHHTHTNRKRCSHEYYLYRCPTSANYHTCPHRKELNEEKFESWLLENIGAVMAAYQVEWELAAVQEKGPVIDRAAILHKLEKLNDLYINDYITMEKYKEEYEKYQKKLQEADQSKPPAAPDFASLRRTISGDIPEIYNTLDRSQRQSFWRGIIAAIHLTSENIPHIFFRTDYTI